MKRVYITGDVTSESKLLELILRWSIRTEKHFEERNYGDGVEQICVVLVCLDAWLHVSHKPRNSFSKKDRCVYVDVMLENDAVTKMTDVERQLYVCDRLANDIPKQLQRCVDKAIVRNFDMDRFRVDWLEWLSVGVLDWRRMRRDELSGF